MNYGIKVLVPDGGQHLQSHAVVFELARGNVVRAAINGDFVTARYQARRQMLGKCFKPAVAGRNSACTEYRYPHDRNYEGLNDRSPTVREGSFMPLPESPC